MRFCPKCGAGIINSNLPKCPMCDADLAAESVPGDLLTRKELPTRWAAVLCVILVVTSVAAMVDGFFVLKRETIYYLQKYELEGTNIESLENFLGFGSYVFAVFTALTVYGIARRKKVGPLFLYITHGIVILSCLRYLLNIYVPACSVEGLEINIMAPVQIIIHTVLFPINFMYFRKRKNVYDDVF